MPNRDTFGRPTVPGAPRNASATAGDASAKVSWNTPLTNGGPSITNYTATSSPGGKTCTTSGSLTCTVSGLTNGQSYTFSGQGDQPGRYRAAVERVELGNAEAARYDGAGHIRANGAPAANQSVGASVTVRVSWPLHPIRRALPATTFTRARTAPPGRRSA